MLSHDHKFHIFKVVQIIRFVWQDIFSMYGDHKSNDRRILLQNEIKKQQNIEQKQTQEAISNAFFSIHVAR